MRKILGFYDSSRWGRVVVETTTYRNADGPLAVLLSVDGEHLATLSVNLCYPECFHDSRSLPPDCFYAKTWGENETIAEEARQSGLFLERPDIPVGQSGYIQAPVWQIRRQQKDEPPGELLD